MQKNRLKTTLNRNLFNGAWELPNNCGECPLYKEICSFDIDRNCFWYGREVQHPLKRLIATFYK